VASEIDRSVDEQVASLLGDAGFRYSTVRRRIVATLLSTGKPLTNYQIVESDDSLVQSSVYRNLVVLEQVGVVTRLTTDSEFARYELTDRIIEHHHHLICGDCGDIADFSLPASVEHSLNLSLRKAASKFKFSIDNHRLDALGICVSCQ